MHKAMFYKKLENDEVQCELCPHYCVIKPDKIGICRARKNINGDLFAINYGKTISLSIDPIEKKPLYHFYPGSKILSMGPNSCNFNCQFCQNYQSSQMTVPTQKITPGKVLQLCKQHDLDAVAYTYTEPITWFEFVLETSQLLKENNIKTVLVTNGFITQKPLQKLLPFIDAMNIDLKAMNEDFYRRLCMGRLKPVLKTIETAYKQTHIELTNLIITDENDSAEEIQKLVDFVAELDPDIPVHFSRYFPTYKMDNLPTPITKLELAKKIAQEKLSYIYLGNVRADHDTNCPNCSYKLIERGFDTKVNCIDGKCPSCGKKIYGNF